MTTTTAPSVRDLPEGYEVVNDSYEVPCDHVACDVMHRHLYNADLNERQLIDLYNMHGEHIGTRWETRFHMATRRQFVILLNGERVGEAHDRKRDALAEAITHRPTI